MRISSAFRQILKKIIILLAVFVAALVVFSFLTNHETKDLTTTVSAASLPTLSFTCEEEQINLLHGYTSEMDARYMRGDLLPISKEENIQINITTYSNDIKELSYEIRSLDTSQLVDSGKATLSKETGGLVNGQINLGNILEDQTEYQFILTLTSGKKSIYYYSRLMIADSEQITSCLNFAKDFHKDSLDETDYTNLSAYIEPESSSDNSSLDKVTIHSSLDQVAWGDFKGSQIDETKVSVQEISGDFYVVSLSYTMADASKKSTQYYNVKEDFRLRSGSDRIYLLDYERQMQQYYNGDASTLSGDTLQLGIRSSQVNYLSNENGSHALFVQNGELWGYNASSNQISKIFSFRSNSDIDERESYQQHDIRLINIAESGDGDFVVYGYMNRGEHEGQVGICVYHYDSSANTIEEEGFLPVQLSYESLKASLGDLMYVSPDNYFYCMLQSNVYQVDLNQGKSKILLKDLDGQQYAVSESGQYFAYSSDDSLSQISVMDLSSQTTKTIKGDTDSFILPLCYSGEDLIYGQGAWSNTKTTSSGQKTYGMSRIYICNTSLEVEKKYSKPNRYITSAYSQGETIYLNLAKKKNKTFVAKGQDTILNNEKESADKVTVSSKTSSKKGALLYLTFPNKLPDSQLQMLTPKYLLAAHPDADLELDLDQEAYFAYAKGQAFTSSTQVSTAIQVANDQMGVVVDQSQNYIWKRSRKTSVSPLISKITDTQGNTSSLARCLNAMLCLASESMSLDHYLDHSGTAEEILTSSIEGATALDLTGCELEHLLYFLSDGRCVLANTAEHSYILLTGYTSTDQIYYYDPTSNSTKSETTKSLAKKLKRAGNKYLTYYTK